MRTGALLLVVGLALFGSTPAFADAPAAAQVPASQVTAKKLSDAFVSVAERVSPSVVQIEVTARDENADQMLRLFGHGASETPVARGTGSGVVLTSDGAILTNNHVIDGALSINVRLRDGRSMPARLVGRDPGTDIAVVKIDATGLTPAKFADSDAARVGEWVVAIGSPFGLGYTVTAGVLSAKGRGGFGMNAIEDYLQTDASINPGNSGGPLCDLNGNVLGINTMIVGKGVGIGFAVPSALARHVGDQLLKTGRVERAWMGVGVQDLTPSLAAAMRLEPHAGALVNDVTGSGPGQRANLRPGDVIATVSGRPVHDSHELVREVLSHEVGQTVQLEIIRDGKHYGTQVTLAARPEQPVPPLPVQQQGVPQSGLGLSVRELSQAQAEQAGLASTALPIITTVVPGSAADRAGLKTGDVIVEADGTPNPTTHQLQDAAKDGALLLRVRRASSGQDGRVTSQAFYAALHR